MRRLGKSRLVVRRANPAAARVCVVSLSAKGRAALNRIRPLTVAREKTLLDEIDEARFKSDLERLMANAEAMLGRAP
jgi:DNA-binding MarR family transcriptional regulator